ncbi:MAG: AMP-dependent synthetase/ligase, partial [Gammaproteobacteria bacterium]
MDDRVMQQLISPQEAGTLPGLFNQRVNRSPDKPAYRSYDVLNGMWMDTTWHEMSKGVERWERALHREKLKTGDRVAIMARNSRLWVMFDQAALALGLVVVPIYTEDRAENVEYILEHSGAKLLVIGGPMQWERLQEKVKKNHVLKRVVAISDCGEAHDKRLLKLNKWLSEGIDVYKKPILSPGDLATIVYTSGTTGRPKGVMLSHRNILSNAWSCSQTGFFATGDEVFLSFLPLSHTFERTVGYYLLIMVGAVVAHSRSIQELSEDLQMVRPEGLITVPRIFERVYARVKENLNNQSIVSRTIFNLAVNTGWRRFQYQHKRASWSPKLLLWPLLKKLVSDKLMARLGGNLKMAICGGAALSPEISRVFVGLGIPVFQGYGLTEASPVVSVNTQTHNIPSSIGPPLPDVEVRIGEHDELQVRGDCVMMGYWHDEEATTQAIDADGWLHTGDKARIDENGHIFITGRIKDIIVLDTGEKVPPVDMEFAISTDPLFEQVVVIGENRPFLSALVVLNEEEWGKFAREKGLQDEPSNSDTIEKALLERISGCLDEFPGYAQIYRVQTVSEPWTVENDLLTPTLKTKR